MIIRLLPGETFVCYLAKEMRKEMRNEMREDGDEGDL